MSWKNPVPILITIFNSKTNCRNGHLEKIELFYSEKVALLQPFPEDYKFYGNMQTVARQISNSIPTKMLEAFGKYFITL